MALTRITITLPADLVRAADKAAKAQDRSRSRVIADAVRRCLTASAATQAPAAVHEVGAPYGAGPAVDTGLAPRRPHSPGLGDQRLAQLKADMALTPEQRVLEAEDTLRVGESRRSWPHSRYVRFFGRYEDFLAWKRVEVF